MSRQYYIGASSVRVKPELTPPCENAHIAISLQQCVALFFIVLGGNLFTNLLQ